MKKRFGLLLLISVFMLAVVACGNKDKDDNDETREKKTKEAILDVTKDDNDGLVDQSQYSSNDGEDYTYYYEETTQIENQNVADSIWDGFYYGRNNYWGDKYGFIDIVINKDGMLDVSYNDSGNIGQVVLNQTYIKGGAYNDPYTIYPEGIIAAADNEIDGVMYQMYIEDWGIDGGEPYYVISFHSYDIYGNDIINMYEYVKIDFDDHKVPVGYEDEDIFGYMKDAINDNSGYFTPESSNYVFKCEPNSIEYMYDRKTWKETGAFNTIRYVLYDFDQNNVNYRSRMKIVFENENEANSWYEYLLSYMSSDIIYIQVGNVIYYETDYERISSLLERLNNNYMWYYDCNYAYSVDYNGKIDTEYISYYYMNTPIVNKEYLELPYSTRANSKFFANWSSGYYSCEDDECDMPKIWFNGYNAEMIHFDPLETKDAFRLYDDYAVSVDYDGYYYEYNENEGYNVNYDAVVYTKTELSLTKVTVTKYYFRYENEDFSSVTATFDNFENADATVVIRHVYDMTKKSDSFYD